MWTEDSCLAGLPSLSTSIEDCEAGRYGPASTNLLASLETEGRNVSERVARLASLPSSFARRYVVPNRRFFRLPSVNVELRSIFALPSETSFATEGSRA